MTDPLELYLAVALDEAGIAYQREGQSPCNLDFYLPAFDLHIEVKQMHSERISAQMARAPNVIAVQGWGSVFWLAAILRKAAAK